MTTIKQDIWQELTWRGLIYQSTERELGRMMYKEQFSCYCGFDPTSDSLHVGNLVPLLGLARMQRAGHRPIALAGGATGLVGDPSGKSQERNLLSREELAANVRAIRKQLEHFVDFNAGEISAVLVDNASWLDGFNLLDFLRDIGKHFTINEMMSKDSVKSRMEQGISYTEFSYMLLQGYDFLHLFKTYGCRLQIGGSDQWGNILAGMELIRRIESKEAYGLTFPLITNADGQKFGKTASGTKCWLDPARTSPYKFYQFFIQVDDRDAVKFLRYFTFLSEAEINDLESKLAVAPEKRDAQRALARSLTEIVHGKTELERSEAASQALFGGDLTNLDERTLLEVFEEAPSYELSKEWFIEGRPLVDTLVEAKIESSKNTARQSLQGGGIYLNNIKVSDVKERLSENRLIYGKYLVVRKGKKNYYLIKVK
ncbi:MAG: tyrosine--tRNA ligase [Acidobacteria bacterium]|nr:tyrosine--tRNA ligase [Acidobacteriota bacterium]